MKILLKIIFLFFIFTNISIADLIKPSSDLKPFDVLMIQLNSLKNNNNPYKDAGIEQTWEFAHPFNKASTGPLGKFKQMIYSDSYKILISHKNSKTIIFGPHYFSIFSTKSPTRHYLINTYCITLF